jgi:uncharacterized protein
MRLLRRCPHARVIGRTAPAQKISRPVSVGRCADRHWYGGTQSPAYLERAGRHPRLCNRKFAMDATIPVNSAFFAAILGLLGALLTANVIVNRVRARVDAGDGGVARLAQAIRAHANFAEQAPLALIVIGLAEASGARALVIQLLGVALLAARLASAYGLNRSLAQSPLRQFGGGVSVLVAIAAAVVALLALAGIR